MKKVILILTALVLLISCSQDVEQIYTATVSNRSFFPIYVRVFRTDNLEDGVFIKVAPYTQQYVLVQDDENYDVAFMLIDSKGETLAEGTFSIGSLTNVEYIIFDSRGRDVSWKITYR